MVAEDIANFRSWFVDPLAKLYKETTTGFPVVMIAFPILERYLRQRLNIDAKVQLTPQTGFYRELFALLPALQDEGNCSPRIVGLPGGLSGW